MQRSNQACQLTVGLLAQLVRAGALNPSVRNIQLSYHFVKFLSIYAGRRLTDIIVMGRTKRTKTSSQPAGPKLKRPRRAKKRSEVK